MEQKGITFDHNLYVVVGKTNLKQINNKKTLVNLYKVIVLVTRVRILCTTLFTNNNIKIVIKSHTFLFHPRDIKVLLE